MQNIRIFVSSPGDVAEERLLTERVVRRVQGWLAGRARLEPIVWEHEPFVATETFQEQIVPPSQTDLVVCILWSRLGTRLPKDFRREDGSTYASGTEWEFEDAAKAARDTGKPSLLVYRKTANPVVSLDEPTEKLLAMQEQRKALDGFLDKWFRNPEDGSFTGAFMEFETAPDYERKLESDLKKILGKELGDAGGDVDPSVAEPWWEGSPFRGLRPFEFDQAPVFFGRTRAIHEVLRAARIQAANQTSFLLLLGRSGSGKSSLVRAGVMPLLVQPGVIEGVGLWRRADMRPGDGVDPFRTLAAALLRDHALPEIKAAGTGWRELAEALRQGPEAALAIIRSGLSAAAGAALAGTGSPGGEAPTARLALLVDQLEELFTKETLTDETRRAFARTVAGLARAKQVWILATLRSDFYSRLADLPELLALKEGSGQYDVLPPSSSEIGQMIRQPAAATGLRYEVDEKTGQKLDDVLETEAAKDPGALPLLAFTLERLYEERKDDVLTFASYRRMGGVEGALARRAEDIYGRLPPAAKAAFPVVMRDLVRVGQGDRAAIVRRDAPLETLEACPGGKELVAAFVDARLLTSDRTPDDSAVVRVCHEALLRRWHRMQDWLRRNGHLLRVRTRVSTAAARWEKEQRSPDFLLQEGKPLEESIELRDAPGFELDVGVRDFVRASLARAKHRKRAKQTAVVALGALTLVAAGMAYQARMEAIRADHERINLLVEHGRSELLDIQPGRALVYLSQAYEARGDEASDTLRFLMRRAAAPVSWTMVDLEHPHPPGTPSTAAIMELETGEDSDPAALPGPMGRPSTGLHHLAAFSPGGGRVAGALEGGGGAVWDAEKGTCLTTLPADPVALPDTGFVVVLRWSRDGRRILTGCDDGTARVWRSGDGKELQRMTLAGKEPCDVVFSPDERLVAAGCWDSPDVQLFDADSGAVVQTITTEGSGVGNICFAPDGKTVVTTEMHRKQGALRRITLWDITATPARATVLPRRGLGGFSTPSFDPATGRIATTDRDSTACVWTAAGSLIELLPKRQAGVNCVMFSPDGKRLVTANRDAHARIWDAETFELLLVLDGHRASVLSAQYSPDGGTVMTRSADGTVRIWDAISGMLLGLLDSGARAVQCAAFRPDGKRVVTREIGGKIRVWNSDVTRMYGDWMLGDWHRHLQRPDGSPAHSGPIVYARYSPDGRRVLTVCRTDPVRIWSADSGELLFELGGDVAAGYRSASFSPDGLRVGTADVDGRVRVWTVADQKELFEIEAAYPAVGAMFSPDGTSILSRASPDAPSGQRGVRLWRATTGEPLGEPLTTETAAWANFGDGGRYVVCVEGETAVVIDVTGKLDTVRFSGHVSAIKLARLHPDEYGVEPGALPLRVVTASADGAADIWDALTGIRLRTLMGHGWGVMSVDVSQDGQRVLTAGKDGTVRVWDAGSGDELFRVQRWGPPVRAARFSPGGYQIVMGDDAGRARIQTVNLELRSIAVVSEIRESYRDQNRYRLVDGRLEDISPHDMRRSEEAAHADPDKGAQDTSDR